MVSAERFSQGMTFDQYVRFSATPENLAREGSRGPRRDWSEFLRKAYESARLSPAHEAAWKWLVSQSGGPAKVLAISEEWSSDCRRDIPTIAKIADLTGMDLRIFPRDGQKNGRGPRPEGDSPNADLMGQFLRRQNGQTFQSIPVVAFYTRDLKPLYTYVEFPAVYHKDRIVGTLDAPKPGESEPQTRERRDREFMDMLNSPFLHVWQCAAVDEWTSLLYERLRLGSLA
jgi:hypothetical protein